MRDCEFSRISKEGEGGPGNGPLAPVDVWQGQEVHVDAMGRPRKRMPQGLAVPPSVHKACGFALIAKGRKKKKCGPGEHRHGKFPCHPEDRKHRGGRQPRPPEKEEEHVSARAIYRRIAAIRREMNDLRWHGKGGKKERKLYAKLEEQVDELWQAWRDANRWERSPEGKAWKIQEKVRRAKAQAPKPREKYEAKIRELETEKERLRDQHHKLYAKYRDVSRAENKEKWQEAYDALLESSDKLRKIDSALQRAKDSSGLIVAREWLDVIKSLAGGVEPRLNAMRAGSKSMAHYDLETGVIGVSHEALNFIRELKNNPGDIDDKVAGPVSTIIHELLHSINPADRYFGWRTFSGAMEEGLTEAIAHRMVQNPHTIKALFGVEKQLNDTVSHSYRNYVAGFEYLAEKAAARHGTDPEWFLGKWKFHILNSARGTTIAEDTGIDEKEMRHLMSSGVNPGELERARKERQEAKLRRVGKPFQRAVVKVLSHLWSVPGFEFKYEPYPPPGYSPASGGRADPHAARAGMAPSAVDVRFTGTPPKDVHWQKLPRQGGGAPGGTGAGAVEAAVEESCSECYN